MSNTITVSKITDYIKNIMDNDPLLSRVSVTGEISNCKYHSSGHIYFTLKDGEAALPGAMFAGKRSGLKFRLKDGDKVVVTGSISVYKAQGKYQLYADSIEPDGEGELYARFLKLKAELSEMGMFDESYKQPIPGLVKRLGVVTAPTGAAVRDIITVSRSRNPYVEIIIYPAQVQGDGAAESIARGIKTLDELGDVDLIIAGRGGGSIEDLWAFNEELVARAIFDCRTPLISAVGHETDFTIADFVADMRAATPSQAAELAVCDINVVLGRIDYFRERLGALISGSLSRYRERTKNFELQIARRSPMSRLNEQRHKAASLSDRMDARMKMILSDKRGRLGMLSASLEGSSPLKKLSGGYSYVNDESGRAVTGIRGISEGDRLMINVTDGVIHTEVRSTESISRKD
ncbi:MAG: exodeoxyribonuclease VII large subunit [Lachnospiraceae bacterium]|nr:exodeoxyribonuclease VII large subunit [Lachnospiraceae bacterium]